MAAAGGEGGRVPRCSMRPPCYFAAMIPLWVLSL